jgi:hypothetical protein
MGASQVRALEELLEGKGFAKKVAGLGLLTGLGARLTRARDLPSPARHEDPLPSSVPGLDRLLAGGLPRGGFVELSGRRSSGLFSVGIAALASATASGETAALVDLGSHLDPQAAQAAGVELDRLLWVRPRKLKDAVASAEMLLATGFPLVVVDLGLAPLRGRFMPDAAWVRLERVARSRGAALLLLAPYRISGIAAEAVVAAESARAVWQGAGCTPRLLAGISSRLTLQKDARARSGLAEPLRLFLLDAVRSFPPPADEGEGRDPGLSPRQARNPRNVVEARIETENARNLLTLHDSQMKGVSGRQLRAPKHDPLGALDVSQLHREDLVGDSQKSIEGGLDRVAPVDGHVPMENLLEHFGIRDEALFLREEPLEDLLRVSLVGMRRSHQIHRDVRVEEDQRDGVPR